MSLENSVKILRERYPTRIPVLIETKQTGLEIPKKKYLVPKDYTVRDFQQIIRKKLDLRETEAIFIFVNDMMCLPSTTFKTILQQQNNPDYLKIVYGKEETFG